MEPNIDLSDFDNCIKTIEHIGNDFPKKGVRQAIRAAAKILLNELRKNVPVDSGTLRDSLTLKSGKRKKDYVGMLIGFMGFTGKAFYGGMVEYGHLTGSRKSKGRTKVEGEHFAEHSLIEVRDLMLQTLIEGLARAIDQYKMK